MNVIWGFLLALFLAFSGEYLAGIIAPALGLQKGAISGIMMAILLGILVNNLFKLPEFLRPGIKFSVVRILRLGIVLLGIRLSIVEAGAIGLKALPVIIGTILAAIAIVTYVSRRVGLTDRLGTLIGVGTASAAPPQSSRCPHDRRPRRRDRLRRRVHRCSAPPCWPTRSGALAVRRRSLPLGHVPRHRRPRDSTGRARMYQEPSDPRSTCHIPSWCAT
jgi:hypothetical protein